MKRLVLFALPTALMFAQVMQQGQEHSRLKVGDEAPDFTLPATNNQTVKLSDFRGKKTVVLAFFPAAFTGG